MLAPQMLFSTTMMSVAVSGGKWVCSADVARSFPLVIDMTIDENAAGPTLGL